MARRNPNQDNTQASIFGVIFLQNAKTRKGFKSSRKTDKDLEGTSEGLYDIVENAGLFPLEHSINSILGGLDEVTTISDPQGRIKFGMFSFVQMLTDPNAYIRTAQAKYKAKRDWARIGGFVSGSMDGALFSLLSYRAGLNSNTAWKVSDAFSSGLDSPAVQYDWMREEKLEKAKTNSCDLIAQRLSLQYGVDEQIAQKFVREAVQKHPEDKGSYLRGQLNLHKVDTSTADEIVETVYGSATDNYSSGLLSQNTNKVANAYQRIALNTVAAKAVKQGNQSAHNKAVKYLEDLKHGSRKTVGVRAMHTLNTLKWLKEGIGEGEFGQNLFTGEFDKLGVVEEQEMQLTFQGATVQDSSGKAETMRIIQPKDTLLAKTIGSLYYIHPANIIRHFVVQGDGWLLLAKKGNTIRKDSFGYLMYEMNNKLNPFSYARKAGEKVQGLFEGAYKKFRKIFKIDALTGFLKKLVTTIFPSAIPGFGFVIGIIMDWIGDEIFKIFMGILSILALAVVGIFIILFAFLDPGTYGIPPLPSPLSSNLDTSDLGLEAVISDESKDASTNPLETEVNTSVLPLSKVVKKSKLIYQNPLEAEVSTDNFDLDEVANISEQLSFEEMINWGGDLAPLSDIFEVLPDDIEIINPLEIDPDKYKELDLGSVSSNAIDLRQLEQLLALPVDKYKNTLENGIQSYKTENTKMYEAILETETTYSSETDFWTEYFNTHNYDNVARSDYPTGSIISGSKSNGREITVVINSSSGKSSSVTIVYSEPA